MLRVSKPRTLNPLSWWDDEERMARMSDYCRQDAEVESRLDKMLPPLSPSERTIWLATARLDDRGVAIDRELVARLIELAAAARLDLNKQLAALTGGAVPKVSNHAAFTRWLISQGLEIEGASKDLVQELLDRDDLDPLVRAVPRYSPGRRRVLIPEIRSD
jgi:DNA polymerase bacteriophage-type